MQSHSGFSVSLSRCVSLFGFQCPHLWNKDTSDLSCYLGHSRELSDLLRSGQRLCFPFSELHHGAPKLLVRSVAPPRDQSGRKDPWVSCILWTTLSCLDPQQNPIFYKKYSLSFSLFLDCSPFGSLAHGLYGAPYVVSSCCHTRFSRLCLPSGVTSVRCPILVIQQQLQF